MKSKMLLMSIGVLLLCTTVGSLAHGATITHKTEKSCFVADLGGSLDASAFIITGLAILEVAPDITPVYPYAGEVKAYTLRSSYRRISLFRMARDGLL